MKESENARLTRMYADMAMQNKFEEALAKNNKAAIHPFFGIIIAMCYLYNF